MPIASFLESMMLDHPRRQQRQHYVVTGAGTGIGRAIAMRLAAEGAQLTLIARNQTRLETTAEAISSSGGLRPSVETADIRDQAEVEAAFDRAHAQHGPLRGLIANSGIGGSNEPGPSDRFVDLVQTNLVGSYHCLRAAQTHLAPGPEPRHLVVISSILARFGVPGYTGYCASKSALLGLTRALAMELATDLIQVNALCPGWVNTEMAREGIEGIATGMGVSYNEALAEAMKAVPMGRMSEPEHVAGLVAWLVSTDAVGVTGQTLDMNNGAWM